jgi:MFS family permease
MLRLLELPEVIALRSLTADGKILLWTRVIRMFAYGCISVILVLYFAAQGLDQVQIGLLLSATLIGDLILSLLITVTADRIGRKRMLMLGTGLMIFAGAVLALTGNPILLILAAIVGTISPTGGEVGPFLSIEQASLPQTTQDKHRTSVFAWYNLIGSLATACGALVTGLLVGLLQRSGANPLASYRIVIGGYAVLGILLSTTFTRLSAQIEPTHAPAAKASGLSSNTPGSPRYQTQSSQIKLLGERSSTSEQTHQPTTEEVIRTRFGLYRSRRVVFKLAGLFMLDAFAGGLVLQAVIAYWFTVKFAVNEEVLGGIFFGANLLAGLSALVAGRIANRFGLINTMVWTHIPSNILLICVPLMPTLPLAILVLLIRFSISQMDVPTRQSYTMAVVDPAERSAAAGITTLIRTVGSASSPLITGVLFSASLFSAPFFLAGALKIVYDLMLYRNFQAVKPPEEG